MKTQLYSWSQFVEDVLVLTNRIRRSKFKPKTVIAIANGGLHLGGMLAYRLRLPLRVIHVRSYNGIGKRSKPKILTVLDKDITYPVLLVDDISDSGSTFLTVSRIISKGCRTVSLFIKSETKFIPDFYVRETKNWICFPWEK